MLLVMFQLSSMTGMLILHAGAHTSTSTPALVVLLVCLFMRSMLMIHQDPGSKVGGVTKKRLVSK